jgi:hypothetical protein
MATIKTYHPTKRGQPMCMTKHPSAWGDIPSILEDLIERFGILTSVALEFGTEYGYSTSALANYFDRVVGVDTFTGDFMTGLKSSHYDMTREDLSSWPNISLIQSTYQDYTRDNNDIYGLVHVDIVHTYEDTYLCGEWSLKHSDVVIFHDTESFPQVKHACSDLADRYGLNFYNYPHSHGLGILTKR